MNCETCAEKRKQAEPVPYIVVEANEARHERKDKRMTAIIIILIVVLIGTNVGWLIYESQFETVITEERYEATTDDGGTAIANGSGTVNYGDESFLHKDYDDPAAENGR